MFEAAQFTGKTELLFKILVARFVNDSGLPFSARPHLRGRVMRQKELLQSIRALRERIYVALSWILVLQALKLLGLLTLQILRLLGAEFFVRHGNFDHYRFTLLSSPSDSTS